MVIGQPFKNQRKPANPWRHLWGRMQVCCIYQGQACILVNFRGKNRHKDGQNMKEKEESICVSLFWCKDLVTLTILPLNPKDFDKLWFKSRESNWKATAVKLHCITISITRYSTGRPTPSGLYPWSSLRICRWETLQKGPIPGAARCLATTGVPGNLCFPFSSILHDYCSESSLIAAISTPLSCSQCCGGRR